MSLSALATAIPPHAPGSSTMGVKKSTVATRARSGDSRNTAASSRVAASIRTRGSPMLGRWRRTCARSAAPSLQAQPAPWDNAVSLMRGFWSMGVSGILAPVSGREPRSLPLLLGPDQRPKCNQRAFLLGSRAKAPIGTLLDQQRWDSAPYRLPCLLAPD